ncbi:bifunctional glutamate N-acetyltransferase/amino-acid acetyltransferase ArgJ [Lachnoclostridium sp. Marseille-P6806]|uniref:bifunctional glutamate N-acetyltransferase/amino-acid acetyltransferase ArgJ n=1 Tax=Lachnoclostridium sp. Marseille-P6806 TaxID=2364793 RepID=UPI001030ED04|nr:bifunctional glutamate N-acetyltransferase/amino-acid acetyltransferase ArgJ [Lachnoclostridium sp. Marseille-P6806]
MQYTEGGVAAAKGFHAAAAAAHIRYEGRSDMALVFSETPCTAAGVFTSNIVQAAPVQWDRERLKDDSARVRAVVVNAGIANACTGAEGLRCCGETAEAAASALGIRAEEVLLGSTGVIGMALPMDKIRAGVRSLAAGAGHSREKGTEAAAAIMTTDTVRKEAACTFTVRGQQPGEAVSVTLGGMSKGSGMIHPNMCTMLAYVTTDLAISKTLLDKAVRAVTADTFNMISVDGDTSTNDTFLCLANGLAGNMEITAENEDYAAFEEALRSVCRILARAMAADGEGATKLIETTVMHAATKNDARKLARSVVSSNLTKAAVYGRDANWGRILCALGYAGAAFDPDRTELYFAAPGEAGREKRLLIFSGGRAEDYSEAEAAELLSGAEVRILCDMHMGEEEATAWGCDLTFDYVRINADYRS